MDSIDDIEIHELEAIERNLSGERAADRDAGDISASGFMVLSASGFMVLSASGFMVL